MVSRVLTGQRGLPLPIFESVEAAFPAAADFLGTSERRALLIEDGASLTPQKA
jgi:hypothetical protein